MPCSGVAQALWQPLGYASFGSKHAADGCTNLPCNNMSVEMMGTGGAVQKVTDLLQSGSTLTLFMACCFSFGRWMHYRWIDNHFLHVYTGYVHAYHMSIIRKSVFQAGHDAAPCIVMWGVPHKHDKAM